LTAHRVGKNPPHTEELQRGRILRRSSGALAAIPDPAATATLITVSAVLLTGTMAIE